MLKTQNTNNPREPFDPRFPKTKPVKLPPWAGPIEVQLGQRSRDRPNRQWLV